MILIDNFSQVLAQIESERGIEKSIIVDGIEKALVSAAKRKHSQELNVKSIINEDSGEARIWMEKTVVKTYEDEENELLLSEAKELDKNADIGDIIEIDLDINDFGRLAAQAAKQVIFQCMREAEKDMVISEFSDKIGQIVTGTVQNIEGNTYLINLGKIEAFLTPREQIPGETFNVKDRIRVYIVDIQKNSRGPMIKISRSHTGLVRELFAIEVPEIQDKIIQIKHISRDAGKRTKIAVHSTNDNVGAVGTCVGHMGGRIQAVLRELNNEKIDILDWNENPATFISNSLKPATIANVIIENEELREATVVVPDDQLSLAIGKGGQNVRLAVKLTNWKLDIISESDYNKKHGIVTETPSEAPSLADRIKQAKEEATAQEATEQEEATQEEATEQAEATAQEEATQEDATAQESKTQEEVAQEEATQEDSTEKVTEPSEEKG